MEELPELPKLGALVAYITAVFKDQTQTCYYHSSMPRMISIVAEVIHCSSRCRPVMPSTCSLGSCVNVGYRCGFSKRAL